MNRTFLGASLMVMVTIGVLSVVWFLEFLSFTDYFESEGFTLGISVGQALSSETSDDSEIGLDPIPPYPLPLPLQRGVVQVGRAESIRSVELKLPPAVKLPRPPSSISTASPRSSALSTHRFDDR